MMIGICIPVMSETIYYRHPELHLLFTLNTSTMEATVGNGIDERQNAICYPDSGDPWWNESPRTNYWRNIDIPETITCEGKAYTYDGGVTTIQQGTYTVTGIAPKAFNMCSWNIQTVQLPETVSEIGSFAFAYNTYLKSIDLPSQLYSIEPSTFIYCKALESIVLPPSIRYIGNSAFSDCTELKEINIPASCTSIGDDAFTYCIKLSKLIIEDGTTPLKIACSYNKGIDYEGTMPKNYRPMFSDCPLKELYWGRDIEFLSAFVNGWYPPFMEYRYWGVGTNNKDVYIHDGKIFEKVEIGDNVTVIPESMFQYATIPNAITLPSHLVSIGDNAFSNRSESGGTLHQSQLVFPATLASIGKDAFTNCTALGTITCEGTTPPSLPDNLYYHAFWNCNPLFIVPTGCRTTYLNTENWEKFRIVELSDELVTINIKTPGTLLDRLLAQGYQLGTISRLKLKGNPNDDDWANVKKMSVLYDLDISEINLEEISTGQFEKSSLIYIKLPQTIKAIRNNAFYQSRSLSGIIEIPASCTEIENQAFRETGISGVIFNGSVHIGQWAFSGCSNLIDINVTGEQTKVDQYGFASCGAKRITIGTGVEFGESAAALCDNLKEVIFEDGVKSIGSWAFHNLSTLEKIFFEGSVGTIGEAALSNLQNLSEIHIVDIGKWCQITFSDYNGTPGNPLYTPNSNYKDRHLYYNGEELVNIEIPNGVERIGDYCFYNCNKLETVKLPETLITIGNRSFSGCDALKEILLASGLESIGSYAFYQCQSLSNIDIPNTVKSISSCAFYNNKLEKVVVHWKEPINISSNVFYGVPNNCYLYIPIGAATKYSNAGWSCIPNIKAVGILSLKVNSGGTASCEAYVASVSNNTENILFNPYQSFSIKLEPDFNYKILKIKLNGKDVISELENNYLLIDEPEEDLSLSVTFAEEHIEMGDANGDDAIDEKDAIDTASHILKKTPSSFYDYAVDMNDDGVIDITDVLLIIQQVKESKAK